jgi:UDP-2-acetamido-2-deoxy-ribo-hexuluronate aminotransferase
MSPTNIQMVDLKGQYQKIKTEINNSINKCLEEATFINGPAVKEFQNSLENYLNVKHVIPCANGTDALQIALMALDLKPGDEVICPAFTYVATAEVIGLLGLNPIMIDVDPETFNITAESIEKVVTQNTRVIIPVHLYGQCVDMEPILSLAKKHDLFVIEDNAQAMGSKYQSSDGSITKSGTMGNIGCTSFFPSKNLGCYGDGGSLMTNDGELAKKIRMIANHGQNKKYYHKVLGCNSRLDSLQAGILNVKLSYLDEYNFNRNKMANYYDSIFSNIEQLKIPKRQHNSTHVFHQYTLKVLNGKRDELQKYLAEKNIPSMIYYPLPLYKQEAFQKYVYHNFDLPITEYLCDHVLSLPIHTEYNEEVLSYISQEVINFFKLYE